MKSIKSQVPSFKLSLLAGIFSVAFALNADAHAFLEHAEPGVGSSIKEWPKEVRIAFTMEVDSASSSVKVFDASGKEVDGKNVHADPKDGRILIVSLPDTLGTGIYKVVWRAVSKDTHVTQGDFTITKEP